MRYLKGTINFNLMKHLPATIGFLAILTLFVFFKGDPDRAVQAAPNTTYYEGIYTPQDTMRPPSDTVRQHKENRKKEKKEKKENKQRRDSTRRDTATRI